MYIQTQFLLSSVCRILLLSLRMYTPITDFSSCRNLCNFALPFHSFRAHYFYQNGLYVPELFRNSNEYFSTQCSHYCMMLANPFVSLFYSICILSLFLYNHSLLSPFKGFFVKYVNPFVCL